MSSCKEIWYANEWMRDFKPAQNQLIAYKAIDGTPLTAWLLLPPDYTPGTKLPMVTIVYPGTMYDAASSSSFSLFESDFEHPQLFAALGYAVLLPSMPLAKGATASDALASLPSGVLPALDAVIERGIVDSDRIAVVGQNYGGFAFAQQQPEQKFPWRGLADCRIRSHAYGELAASMAPIKRASKP
jgi:dipeptidyl aminopeptidase/acylaminoacyl peptidase